mmetsp:Transcript_25351/g.57595  ORF Transcript_25351/g.57595 Transcript_25351/m.57595 type:complete len:231 (+) Transcript_25351:1042-1734(+)
MGEAAVPGASGHCRQRRHDAPGKAPHRVRGRCVARGHGHRLHLHHAGGLRLRPRAGLGGVQRGQVREVERHPRARGRRHLQPRAHRQGALLGRRRGHVREPPGRHRGDTRRVLLLRDGCASEAVPRHGFHRRHEEGLRRQVFWDTNHGQGRAGRVRLGPGQGLHPQVRPVPRAGHPPRLPGHGRHLRAALAGSALQRGVAPGAAEPGGPARGRRARPPQLRAKALRLRLV